jgi:hypothetical protein
VNIKEITDAARERKRAEMQKAPLAVIPDDPCCAKRLTRALHVTPNIQTWECPKCGCEWKAVDSHDVRAWEPVVAIEVFR